METGSKISRRRLLSATSGRVGIGALGTKGVAGKEGRIQYNIGYAMNGGRQAARDAAVKVVQEFAFDARTIEVPKLAALALGQHPDIR